MNWTVLLDLPSGIIVFGGTIAATILRCGLGDCLHATSRIIRVTRPAFCADAVRADLAVQVQAIRREGLLRAPQRPLGDRAFAEATDALLHRRSLGALLACHEADRDRRRAMDERAIRTLAQAAELAPVLGLAGTLVSLSQLPAHDLARGAFAGSIAMAVVTTLYGVIAANFLFAPLARLLERTAQREATARQAVIDWLAGQLASEEPGERPVRTQRAA